MEDGDGSTVLGVSGLNESMIVGQLRSIDWP